MEAEADTEDCPTQWQEPEEEESSSSETYLVGFVIANIVGIQYYSGTISGREMVGLVREPLNPYDPNAIKVLNTRQSQVGHVERNVAAVLSPLLDSGELAAAEGIVPRKRTQSSRFRIPCQIHLFARPHCFDSVRTALGRAGLALISDGGAAFGLSESAVAMEEREVGREKRSVDRVFDLAEKGLRRLGAMEAIEPPRDVIRSELFEHQKQGLWWLWRRENCGELPPFWEEDQKDGFFVNSLTNYRTRSRPEPIRGGVFADDMGLGKTLTLLSLIALDSFSSSSDNVDELRAKVSVSSAKKSRRGCGASGSCDNVDELRAKVSVSSVKNSKRGCGARGSSDNIDELWENVSASTARKGKRDGSGSKGVSSRKRRKFEGSDADRKTTLVVCPLSVLSTWVTQLGEHTVPGSFKVYMYHGNRTKDVDELKKYTVVLTTYGTLATECSWPSSAAREMNWWRVILDEAHMIKNVNAVQSRAVCDLKADRRWVVTGTPIQNDSFDLFSLMAFLRFEPFSVKSYWQSLVQRPLSQGNKKGLSRLQVLMATISLRRTKDKGLIGLPQKTIETCFVELTREERELYDQMESAAKEFLKGYLDAGSPTCNYTTVLSTILRLRQICTDVALWPSDLKSLLPTNNIEDVSNNPELLQKIVEVLQDGEDFDCPICISSPTDMVITRCGHIYCHACITKTLKHTKSTCPLCRGPLSTSDLFSAPPPSSDAEDKVSTSRPSVSSKISALLKLLTASRDSNPAISSVVFSQFTKMLTLLEMPLKEAGFKVLRIDGSMSAKRRAKVIKEFSDLGIDDPTVLLASLKATGTGINLTAASRVYFFEPWWNPAVEEQAMDRVHRIGQKEEVKVVRLIARDTIEERVLKLQERKKKLAKEAFGKRGSKDRREIGIGDLRTLLSM